MVAIIRTEWSGTSGGPGLTQMAMSGGFTESWAPTQTDPAVAAVREFWAALTTILPNELTLTVSPVVDIYSRLTAVLEDSVTAVVPPLPVQGAATSQYAGGAGLKVNWNTGRVANGRRVAGHSYIVPTTINAFNANGGVATATQTLVNNAADALLQQLRGNEIELMVWSRPKETPVARPGELSVVIAGQCSSKSAILRGRRD